jgi:hypothetical protein
MKRNDIDKTSARSSVTPSAAVQQPNALVPERRAT